MQARRSGSALEADKSAPQASHFAAPALHWRPEARPVLGWQPAHVDTIVVEGIFASHTECGENVQGAYLNGVHHGCSIVFINAGVLVRVLHT